MNLRSVYFSLKQTPFEVAVHLADNCIFDALLWAFPITDWNVPFLGEFPEDIVVAGDGIVEVDSYLQMKLISFLLVLSCSRMAGDAPGAEFLRMVNRI